MAEITEELRGALEQLGRDVQGANRRLEAIYAEDVVFKDPIQTVRGREAFLAMNRRLARRSRRLGFEVTEARRDGDLVFLTWTFEMQPRPFGPTLRGEGASAIRLANGEVVYHRDYFDLIGAAMDAVPGVGFLYRALIASLG